MALHPRRNYIIRRASNLSKESHIIAANIDQALLVVSLVRPATNSEFIDRFLVTAGGVPHSGGDPAQQERPLYDRELQQQRARFIETYTRAGYDVVELSASRGEVLRINPARARRETRTEATSGLGGDADSGSGAGTSVMSGMGTEPLLERLRDRVTLLSAIRAWASPR